MPFDDPTVVSLETLLRGRARDRQLDQVGKCADSLIRARNYAALLDKPRNRNSGEVAALKAIGRIEVHARGLLKEIQDLRRESFWALVTGMEGEDFDGILVTEAESLLDRLEQTDLPAILAASTGAQRWVEKNPTKVGAPRKEGAAHVANVALNTYTLLSDKKPRRGPASDEDDGSEDSDFIRFLGEVYKILGFRGVSPTSQARKALDRHRKMVADYYRYRGMSLAELRRAKAATFNP